MLKRGRQAPASAGLHRPRHRRGVPSPHSGGHPSDHRWRVIAEGQKGKQGLVRKPLPQAKQEAVVRETGSPPCGWSSPAHSDCAWRVEPAGCVKCVQRARQGKKSQEVRGRDGWRRFSLTEGRRDEGSGLHSVNFEMTIHILVDLSSSLYFWTYYLSLTDTEGINLYTNKRNTSFSGEEMQFHLSLSSE